MLRGLKMGLGLLAVLALTGEARAQWSYGAGYGRYGWGSWGGGGATVQGDIARGSGFYLMGAGQYNRDTAIANSINTDTALRWNQYWWEAQLAANRAERARLARRQARDSGAGAAIEKRILDSPAAGDIENGDALNAALDQITDPRIHGSALRLATSKVPAKAIRAIPFVNASEAITICLDRLTTAEGWPVAFLDAKFDDDRKAYTQAIEKALEEDRDGDLKPHTIQEVRTALARLRTKLEAAPPADKVERAEAENYLKTLFAMTRMLDRADYDKLLAELDKVEETSLGSLLSFMHTFNLRFGPAKSPTQRAAYDELYPLIDAHRDRMMTALGAKPDGSVKPTPAPPAPGHPTDFFSGMKLEHLEGAHKLNGTGKP
jgi:hypothetical protein